MTLFCRGSKPGAQHLQEFVQLADNHTHCNVLVICNPFRAYCACLPKDVAGNLCAAWDNEVAWEGLQPVSFVDVLSTEEPSTTYRPLVPANLPQHSQDSAPRPKPLAPSGDGCVAERAEPSSDSDNDRSSGDSSSEVKNPLKWWACDDEQESEERAGEASHMRPARRTIPEHSGRKAGAPPFPRAARLPRDDPPETALQKASDTTR